MPLRLYRPGAAGRWLVLAGTLAAAAAAHADEWAIEPSIGARLAYNDNIDLQPSGSETTTSLSLNPGIRFANRTERRQTHADFGLSAQHHFDGREEDATDFSGNLSTSWLGERDQFGLVLTALQDSTLRTELETTGVVQARRQRRLLGVAPSWSHRLSEVTALQASYRYNSVRYESGPGLVDYDDQAATLGLQRALSERWTVSASGGWSEYRPQRDATRSETVSASMGAAYRHSERLSLNLDVGRQRTTTEQLEIVGVLCSVGDPAICQFLFGVPFDTAVIGHGETRTSGLSYSAGLGYRLETGSLAFSASRGVSASGTGAALRTDRVALAFSRQLSERVSWAVDASWVRSRNADGSGVESRYWRVGQGLQWQIDRGLSVNLGVSHAERPGEGGQARASSNEVSLGVAYAWPPLTLSR